MTTRISSYSQLVVNQLTCYHRNKMVNITDETSLRYCKYGVSGEEYQSTLAFRCGLWTLGTLS